MLKKKDKYFIELGKNLQFKAKENNDEIKDEKEEEEEKEETEELKKVSETGEEGENTYSISYSGDTEQEKNKNDITMINKDKMNNSNNKKKK